jgi:hypothetical protein
MGMDLRKLKLKLAKAIKTFGSPPPLCGRCKNDLLDTTVLRTSCGQWIAEFFILRVACL